MHVPVSGPRIGPLRRGLAILAALAVGSWLALAAGCGGGGSENASGAAARPTGPAGAAPTDHTTFFREPFADGPSVTRACLGCHEDAARGVMATSHWTWLGDEVQVEGRDEPVRIGKANLINNFCIGIEGNEPRCTSCHAGYGWAGADFDFEDESLVDCLVCHDRSGGYRKADAGAGLPAEGVDLLAAARSVGRPTRQNCGICHFRGGGGDAVKHGDLDGTMYFPAERIDVHMGRYDLQCVDCHRTSEHEIAGRSMSVSVSTTNRIRCEDCHDAAPHRSERLNAHVENVACQSCHIPFMAVDAPTKMTWDWSAAGQDPEGSDPRLYNKKKGRFTFARNAAPEYRWYNGEADRYLKGAKMDPTRVTDLNPPRGDLADPRARIWPFKVHRGRQPYDKVNRHFLVPRTFGEGGYWTEYDWDRALAIGGEHAGLDYSGEYGFAATAMYWPLSHMVAPRERALQCTDCHGPAGRLDWRALGYGGDPALTGAPGAAASDHPEIEFLDREGVSVLESGGPVSPVATCGACHDAATIAAESYHADAGFGELAGFGRVEGGRPWDAGPGPYGRFEPLTYRGLAYALPSGEVPAPDSPAVAERWLREFGGQTMGKGNGNRHVGSGPASVIGPRGPEMDCFLCHLELPDPRARDWTLEHGEPAWSATATLAATGLVELDGERWRWNEAALAEGAAGPERMGFSRPGSAACGNCHGLVDHGREPLSRVNALFNFADAVVGRNWATVTRGEIFSPQRLVDSGLNLQDKERLVRPWDVHAARLLDCADCHFSLNDPAALAEAEPPGGPAHLRRDPRRRGASGFREQPSHNLAKGYSAYGAAASGLDGTMRRCEDCHEAQATHDWLPETQRHLDAMTCESCHLALVSAPARRETDWTVLRTWARPRTTYRGANGDVEDPATLITGYRPLLLPRREGDREGRLAPYNLIASWYWVAGSPPLPVALEDLRGVFLRADSLGGAGNHDPEIVAAFDDDGDGMLDEAELVLDTADKTEFVRARLEARGLANPRIVGEIQPYGVHHGTAPGAFALRDCNACHSPDDPYRVGPVTVATALPGGVVPTLVGDTNVSLPGELAPGTDGTLVYEPLRAGIAGYPAPHGGSSSRLYFFVLLLVLAAAAGVTLYRRSPKRRSP